MKFVVTVQRYKDEQQAGEEVYSQAFDGDAFDLNALVRAFNVKKRVRAPRAKKGGDA